MILTLTISIISIVIMIVLVFLGNSLLSKIKFPLYILPLILGAVLLICFNSVSLTQIKDSFLSSSSVNPLKILLLFLSMSFFSIYLDELGLFEFLAISAVKLFNKKQIFLFMGLYALIAILTIFTSNDIIILTFTPFICQFTKRAHISPLPYLMAEFICANTWSMLFIIGNPTNIYLATYSSLSFFEYLKVMYLPTIFAGLTSFVVLLLVFNKKLKEQITVSDEENYKIKNKASLVIALSLLIICTLLLVISSYLNFEMCYISFGLFVILFITEIIHAIFDKTVFKDLGNAFLRLPYQVIPLLISMFIIVLALNNCGISQVFASFLNRGNNLFMYGIFSTLFCNLMNNIPMSVFFSSLSLYANNPLIAIYASIIGSNIGAFITPIGALAGIMFCSIISKNKVKFSYLQFCLYGSLIAIPTLFMALLGLLITL